jgi:large subunit ribosomal protein L28
MPKVCQVTGAKPRSGSRIHRSGLAKSAGGIGRHVTKVVKRILRPNIQSKRIFVPELDKWVKVKLTARAIKTINKNGAYKTLLKAGIVEPIKVKSKKAAVAAK